ncbi:cilia- and flagella-associated protein 20-like [Microplitis mediator]|uniref:cilia- and flagella-associated protein 20-like n=1 Tax=Microplitis mediator TaxID=375433 RepID=UPI00255237A8|nr:cilia- and flagella-associated protein 20-like [Microplitis mediator]
MSKLNYDNFEFLLCSVIENPLVQWSKFISLDGKIKRVKDNLLKNDRVIEVIGKSERSNSKDYIPTSLICPADPEASLDIKLPVLVLVLKNLKLEGKIEFQIIDECNCRRRFVLVANTAREKIQKITATTAFIPLVLADNWNKVEINLITLCKGVYSTDYKSFQRIVLHPNFRFRRVYLHDHHYQDNDDAIGELYQALTDLNSFKNKKKSIKDESSQTQPIIINSKPKIKLKKRKK